MTGTALRRYTAPMSNIKSSISRIALVAGLGAALMLPVWLDQALAQQSGSEPGSPPAATPETSLSDGQSSESTEAPSDSLDALFARLKRAATEDEAKAVNREIQVRWLESGSDTVNLLMQRALKAMETKDYPLSLDLLDSVIDLKPGYAEGWNKRATVFYLMNDYGRSIGDIEQTLKLEPRHFGALSGLGSIFKKLGKDADALKAYERALELHPRHKTLQEAYKTLIEELDGRDT